MKEQPLIEIITPAYNAEPYIDDFFRSLLDQDFQNWRIIARDDGSSDRTPQKLEEWQKRLGDKMLTVPNPDGKNLGARGSFSLLFTLTTAPWVACGDADDIWLSNRLSIAYNAATTLEAGLERVTPILVATDAYIVDCQLNKISDSVWSWQKLNPNSIRSFPRMLMDHPILGATTLANRRAIEISFPLPDHSIDHDWWLGLVVSTFGICKILPQKTMLYRRHDHNTSALALSTNPLMALTQAHKWKIRLNKIMNYTALQALALKKQFENDLTPKQIITLDALIGLADTPFLERKLQIFRHRLWFSSLAKNVIYFLFV